MKEKVFIYGSLLPGLHNHQYMRGSRYLGTGHLIAAIYDLGNHIPGVVLPDGGCDEGVWGQVWAIPRTTLLRLDLLEGHPLLYQRVQREIRMVKGFSIESWVYVWQHGIDGCPFAGDDWKLYVSGKPLKGKGTCK